MITEDYFTIPMSRHFILMGVVLSLIIRTREIFDYGNYKKWRPKDLNLEKFKSSFVRFDHYLEAFCDSVVHAKIVWNFSEGGWSHSFI